MSRLDELVANHETASRDLAAAHQDLAQSLDAALDIRLSMIAAQPPDASIAECKRQADQAASMFDREVIIGQGEVAAMTAIVAHLTLSIQVELSRLPGS